MNPYSPPADGGSDSEVDEGGGATKPLFNMTPYERPDTKPLQAQQATINPSFSTSTESSLSGPRVGGDGGGGGMSAEVGLRLSGVANVWGPAMEVKKEVKAPEKKVREIWVCFFVRESKRREEGGLPNDLARELKRPVSSFTTVGARTYPRVRVAAPRPHAYARSRAG